MVGGPLSFSLGGYYGTPLNTILPVELPSSIAADALIVREPSAELTDVGRRHPITRLVNTELDNDLRWREMAEMEGSTEQQNSGPTHSRSYPTPASGMRQVSSMPVVSVREVAQGRTMAVHRHHVALGIVLTRRVESGLRTLLVSRDSWIQILRWRSSRSMCWVNTQQTGRAQLGSRSLAPTTPRPLITQ